MRRELLGMILPSTSSRWSKVLYVSDLLCVSPLSNSSSIAPVQGTSGYKTLLETSNLSYGCLSYALVTTREDLISFVESQTDVLDEATNDIYELFLKTLDSGFRATIVNDRPAHLCCCPQPSTLNMHCHENPVTLRTRSPLQLIMGRLVQLTFSTLTNRCWLLIRVVSSGSPLPAPPFTWEDYTTPSLPKRMATQAVLDPSRLADRLLAVLPPSFAWGEYSREKPSLSH
jgi:hypothetical protein